MIDLFAHVPILMGAPQAGAASGSASGQMMTTFMTFGLVILIFYFLIIRPQNKKQKETKKMIEALKKGDKVATIGGIRGTVTSVKETTVVIKVDTNAKIEFSKSAVANVLERKQVKEEEPESAEESAEAEEKE
jgi:preprotein translocase subunit YajC